MVKLLSCPFYGNFKEICVTTFFQKEECKKKNVFVDCNILI